MPVDERKGAKPEFTSLNLKDAVELGIYIINRQPKIIFIVLIVYSNI